MIFCWSKVQPFKIQNVIINPIKSFLLQRKKLYLHDLRIIESKVMRIIFFIFLFSGFLSFGFSQEHLKRLMDNMDRQNLQQFSQVPVKNVVPSVFGVIPENTYLGISDPACSDTIRAKNQAYARAVFVYALQSGKGRGVTDFFHADDDSDALSNFEELYEMYINCKLPLNRCDIEYFHLLSGEVIAVLKVNPRLWPKKPTLFLNGVAESYSKEISEFGNEQSIKRLTISNELTYSNVSEKMTENYRYYSDSRKKLKIDCKFDDVWSDFENYRYFYIPNDSANIHQEDNNGALVYNGLWYAFISDLFRQVTKQYLNEQIRVKQVRDQYKSKLISLNRETKNFNFHIVVKELILKDDRLWVVLSR